MVTHWQSYRGGPTKPQATVVNISINSSSVITLNQRAADMLGDPDAVLLVFDEKNSIIGLIASNRREPEAFPLPVKNRIGRVINTAPFCRHFNISVDRTECFVDPDMDSDGILRLDLKRTINVSRRKPRGERAAKA